MTIKQNENDLYLNNVLFETIKNRYKVLFMKLVKCTFKGLFYVLEHDFNEIIMWKTRTTKCSNMSPVVRNLRIFCGLGSRHRC